jgi:hypothetical protein
LSRRTELQLFLPRSAFSDRRRRWWSEWRYLRNGGITTRSFPLTVASAQWARQAFPRDASRDDSAGFVFGITVVSALALYAGTEVLTVSKTILMSYHQPFGQFCPANRLVWIESSAAPDQSILPGKIDIGSKPLLRIDIGKARKQLSGCRSGRPPNPVIVDLQELVLIEAGNNHFKSFGPIQILLRTEVAPTGSTAAFGIDYPNSSRLLE